MSSYGLFITAATSLLLGLTSGFVMHRSGFCMAGMVRDLFLFRNTFMLRIMTLLVLANMLMCEAAHQLGLIGIFPYPAFGAPAMTNVAGGLLFGVGMVLAGGCVAGTLYKMGSGNIISVSAFIGLIIGSAVYAEFHAVWKTVSHASIIFPGKVTIAQIIDLPQDVVISVAAVLLAIVVACWWRSGRLVRYSPAIGYLQPWKAALVLAFLVLVSVIVIGVPLGITTSYVKMGAWLENLIVPAHVAETGYFKLLPLAYFNSLLGMDYSGGPGPHADAITLIQFPLVGGIVAGGFLSARLLGEFHIYCNVPRTQYLAGFAGGLLMGLAARMAPSCNIWHLMGGVPILAAQSILFAAGLLPGAWLGTKILTKLVLKDTQ